MRLRRVALSILLFAVLSIPLAGIARVDVVAAQEQTTETTATTGAAELIYETPAISLPAVVEEDPELPWTTKFLVPASIVLAGLVALGTAVQYFLKVVKNRYKVVE